MSGDAITAALIQGSLTVVAAGVAALVGLRGLENWQKEAVGRRRLELTERCVILGFRASEALMSVRFAVKHYKSDPDVFEEQYRLNAAKETIKERAQFAAKAYEAFAASLADAEAYFGDDILSVKQHMSIGFHQVGVIVDRVAFNENGLASAEPFGKDASDDCAERRAQSRSERCLS